MQDLRKLNDFLWSAYAKFMGADQTAGLIVVVRARSADAASQAASALAALGCDVGDISQRYWPFGRRWQVTATTKPLALDRSSIDSWTTRVSMSVEAFDAVLTHWVPGGLAQSSGRSSASGRLVRGLPVMAAMAPTDARAWTTYRRLKRRERTALVLWLLVIVPPFVVPGLSGLRADLWFIAPVPFVWMLVANYQADTWRCPRCDEPFFRRGFLRTDTNARACVHCGLPKWAEPISR